MNLKFVFLSFTFLVFAHSAGAQISPGKLASPHAQLEGIKNCTKCHTLGGGPDVKKCQKCHVEIKRSIEARKGFHFLVTSKEKQACFECHGEHSGRNFNLIFWPHGQEKFDHMKTGFLLKGKHAETPCRKCHQAKNIVHDPRDLNAKIDLNKTFLGLDQTCLSCHVDEHRGQLSRNCLQCHSFSAWKPAKKFDHNKVRFRLTGKHLQVTCAKCHQQVPIKNQKLRAQGKLFFTKYVGLQFSNCTACHQDAHQGRFGSNCRKCHDTLGWNRINSTSFNHSLTRFPLLGLHRQVGCEKCHGSGKRKNRLRFANCTDCHRDKHFGQFADRADRGRCESCHDVFGFVPAKFDVDEHAKSRYPLTGAHLAVPCVACHFVADRGTRRQRRIFEFSDRTCKGCHQDVHRGQFADYVKKGGCETCHQTSSWEEIRFDHAKTRFPLLGKHAVVQCSQCHKPVAVGTARERILFKPMKMECSDCHKDIHLGQFAKIGQKAPCEKCHQPQGWRALLFDHDLNSLFKLRGAHEKVPCADCHKTYRKGEVAFVLYKPIDRRCVNCHGGRMN
ncbi:MAG: cytochrome C [bacterium]